MKVPFFGLDRQYQRYKQEFLGIADRIWSSGKVLQGPDVAALESTTRAICKREHAIAVGSCTDALAFALEANGVGEGDEVLVTAFSFFASVSQIVRVGAVPVFVDIDPDYYLMRLDHAETLVTPRTKAIIAVHIFGQTLPMAEVEGFAKRHKLLLIEDTAQSLGSLDGSRPAGSMGQVSCMSFDPTKVIGSFSSAGMLLTDDAAMAERVRMMRYHGRSLKSKDFEILGYNSQLASDMAAMLDFKMARLAEWEKERAAIAKLYIEGLEDLGQIVLPKVRQGSTHNWHKFVLQAKNRDQLAEHLKSHGIETLVHYGKALSDEKCILSLNLPVQYREVPVARQAASSVISLPVFPDLREEEVKWVVEKIKEFFIRNRS